MQDERPFKSGFVTVIGRPNVGKSTLVNSLVGRKVAIMSPKPQTTRHRLRAVLTRPEAQIVFVDTPGIHRPQHRLGEIMVEAALQTLNDVDVVLFVIEADKAPGPGDEDVIDRLKGIKTTPVILVINKVDRVARPKLLPLIDEMRRKYPFAEIVPVSALKGDNLERLVETLVGYLPEGPPYFPEDMVSDQPERVLLAELVREKVLHLTAQEVPHSVAVVVEEIAERPNGVTLVRVTVYVERESQKAILIGQGGLMLKRIGQAAREEIEGQLGMKVFLELWVKVRPKWRQNERYLREFGYGQSNG
ncbi:MAG: GTPase Era [Bacillota bacterium]|nr:GTPase Era [Bacillota bacterium]